MNTVTFRTPEQAAIFRHELQGQLSDGHWENTRPYGHWKPWCQAEVKVGDTVGRDFRAQKDNYDFNCGEMLEVIGKRMINYARLVEAGFTVEEAGIYGNLLCTLDGTIEYPHYKTHTGKFWADRRAQIKELQKSGVYDRVVDAIENGAYNWKRLRKDMKEMKLAVRNTNWANHTAN